MKGSESDLRVVHMYVIHMYIIAALSKQLRGVLLHDRDDDDEGVCSSVPEWKRQPRPGFNLEAEQARIQGRVARVCFFSFSRYRSTDEWVVTHMHGASFLLYPYY